jgi:uncharacterized protein (DUF433 family)
MKTFPVLYEIDTDSNEANGVVHFFCTPACRGLWRDRQESEVASRGFRFSHGNNLENMIPDGMCCENCLESVGTTSRPTVIDFKSDLFLGLVEIDQNKLSGTPVLKGTRFPVYQLLAEMADSLFVRSLCHDFELDYKTVFSTIHAMAFSLGRQ